MSAPNSTFKPFSVKRYNILSEVGAGGMGVVYKAMDTALDRAVAIKQMRASFEDEEHQQTGLWEALIGGRFQHPNIVRLYDCFNEGDHFYMVMEYFEGEALTEIFRHSERLDLNLLRTVFAKVCDALSYAHACGVIHRDIKPSNVLVNAENDVRLFDFGISELVASNMDSAVQRDIFRGTVAYSSPEAIHMDPVGPQSDIFALGVMLYEIVVGENPFRGASAHETAQAILTRTPEPPSKVISGIPLAFDHIILRALEKKPEDRYASAEELASDLRNFESLDYFLQKQGFEPTQKTKVRALLVDDDEGILEVMRTVLTSLGIKVRTATNGLRGLEVLEEYVPDVIVSDILMPEMDGHEFQEKVLANEKFSQLPFIFLTSKESPNDRVKGLEGGAEDYIVKPFHPKELYLRLLNILDVDPELLRKSPSDRPRSVITSDGYIVSRQRPGAGNDERHSEVASTRKQNGMPWEENATEVKSSLEDLMRYISSLNDPGDQTRFLRVIWMLKMRLEIMDDDDSNQARLVGPLQSRMVSFAVKGHHIESYALADLLMMIDPDHERAGRTVNRHADSILDAYLSYFQPLSQPVRSLPAKLGECSFQVPVLNRIFDMLKEGQSVSQVISKSGYDRLPTLHHLALLLAGGMVEKTESA